MAVVQDGLLVNALIYLGAAVVAVPVAKRLGLGSVIGYLAAGLIIGPWGLRLITDVQSILHFSEFGVVLLLFLIGLELEPRRLWQMRMPIFGLGGAQVAGCAVLIGVIGTVFGWHWSTALVAGLGLALSSTAIALQPLTERHLLGTDGGRATFSILLFQDIAVIPMLAVLPLLAGRSAATDAEGGIKAVILALLVIGAVVLGGRYLTRPLFRFIAATGMREIFTAAALLIVVGIAVLMQFAGLSMALGTFIAGVLLAESEYRHELESDIEPFKGLLLGLFFTSVGMSVDVGLLLSQPATILGLLLALLLAKALVLVALARFGKVPGGQAALFVFLLAPGGEFAFVLFGAAGQIGAMAHEVAAQLTVAVALSMLAGPLLLVLNDRLIQPRLARGPQRPHDTPEDEGNPVIVAGFGRFGQIIVRLLYANRIGATVLDHDPVTIETLRPYGFKAFYGDATRIDLLEAAGAAKAKVLVVALDSQEASLLLVDIAQRHFPNLHIVARARDLTHAVELMNRAVPAIERETFHSALKLGEATLRALGFGGYAAHKRAQTFRRHNLRLLQDIHAHWDDDEARHISLQQQARARIQQNLDADEAAFTRHEAPPPQQSDKDL
ncbi:glutathione-regulated potassium-efflux system protein KefC [Ferrovibrio sp.]|uniref:glutathione-regulated potassium-efflux system protein KefC n=1 Tax=Ferrovibrio sp. TaxID=1917215 RepID=UPI0025C697A6|nr:glutathione-regulated potassium-efflux system protein KefC [Ferrovibrio sp.]MBX3453950.1 glutathione-regulated potassium-efflux system protein KefC [Ferrovibrio sp.]